jgi:hypothetical protein
MTTDWRLTNQEDYLQSVRLYFRKYSKWSESWDHDHCVFCFSKFVVEDIPDVLHEGYSTEDQYHWICINCFVDFKEKFQWEVVHDSDES